MAALLVRVLGPVEVWRGDEPVQLGAAKGRDLLALLAARSPHAVSVDVLVEELWRGRPPPSARKVVQKHVSELRRRLGPSRVATQAGGYALRGVDIDADRFVAAYEQARFEPPAIAAERLRHALDSWAGQPYADVDLDGLASERARLEELRLAATESLHETRLALGEHAALVPDLERLLAAHPTREAFWSQLMRALWASGRRADALRAYQRVRAVLAEELGIEPSGELRALEQEILAQAPITTSQVAPRPATPHAEAERRVMTIVAVELEGQVDADPEHRAQAERDVRSQLDDWADAAGGARISSLGPRVLIAFGAPTHEDDADRAVRLGHQIVTRMPSARVAVATGWALVQPDADAGDRVVGSVVEVACSALPATAPGTVHVDRSTTAARHAPTDDPPFVGREQELAVTRTSIERTLAGCGPQAITVRGEPGVGKTRLIAQLRSESPQEQLRWVHVVCDQGAPPSEPMRAIIRAVAAAVANAHDHAEIDAVDLALAQLALDPAERDWLRSRLGRAGATDGVAPATLHAVTERSEIVAAWATFLGALAQQRPAVVVLDDVHHTDSAFRSMLADSLRRLPAAPLLVICTARTDQPVFECASGDSVVLTLHGLDPTATDALLGHLLSDDAVDLDRSLIRARSGGIPLYAIHFARMVRQEGWSGGVPFSTRALIAARLDLLAPLERALVLAGAVAHPRFTPAQLAAMQGVEERMARDAVEVLVDKGLFAPAGRDTFALSHGLVRDVAYDQLLRERRARLHEAAATWLEQQVAGNVANEAMRIADHLAAAAAADEENGRDTTELRERSFRMMIVAGQRLEGLGAEDIAIRLGEATSDDHDPRALAELCDRRAAALSRLGRLREAAADAERGLALARTCGDHALEARAAVTLGEVQWLRGETSASLAALEGALALVAEQPGEPATARALATLAFVTALLGRPADAIGLAERGLVLARECGLPATEVRCLNARGAALLLRGEFEGYNDFMRALARSLEAGLGHESAIAYHNLAELHLQGAGPASSAELNEQGLVLAEHRGLALATDWLRANRVAVLFELGRWDEALALAEVVLGSEAERGPGQAGTACGITSARIHVWRGELDRARSLVDRFLPRAREHAVTQQLGPALVVAGLVETASGRLGRGADFAEEFCSLTRETHEYRQMELSDVVRLLVADGRLDDTEALLHAGVLPTIRNQCHSLTAVATLAAARASPDAAARFAAAAERWRTYGHVLEATLADVVAGPGRAGGVDWPGFGEDPLRLHQGMVAALCPAAGTGSRPIRNRPARASAP